MLLEFRRPLRWSGGSREHHETFQADHSTDDHERDCRREWSEDARIGAEAASLPRDQRKFVVPNADHYDFLAPCSPLMAQRVPDVCAERPGFDRTAFHEAFDRLKQQG